jgi:hypothetical protein
VLILLPLTEAMRAGIDECKGCSPLGLPYWQRVIAQSDMHDAKNPRVYDTD